MAKGALTEFSEVFRDFRQLGSLALKGAVAAPLANCWLKFGPPPVNVISVLTSLVEFISVIWVFHFWREADVHQLGRRMKIALAVFSFGLVTSLALLEQFSVAPSEGHERIVEGFQVRPDVKPVLSSVYGPDDALRDNEYDPAKIWTKESISILRLSMVVIWISTFASLAIYLTAFIMSQRRGSVRSRAGSAR
jgi:hypothetical protein